MAASQQLADLVKSLACEFGFDRAGIAPAGPLGREQFLAEWLARGYHGHMSYLARNNHIRNDPSLLMAGAKSVICLARNCRDAGPDDRIGPPPGLGYVARYARGLDYHADLNHRAFCLAERLRQDAGEFRYRVCVDTKPLLERELAARAGIGWVGKNGLLIHPQGGSYCFLAEIVTSLDIASDAPMPDHCGGCRKCIDACPTGAIVEPGVLDARRCISYLTIENRGDAPDELRAKIGCRVFGCDTCQAACPFNRRSVAGESAGAYVDVSRLLAMSDEQIATWAGGGSLDRATPAMWRRNAAIARDNQRRQRTQKAQE